MTIQEIGMLVQQFTIPVLAVMVAIEARMINRLAHRLLEAECAIGALMHMIGVEDIRVGISDGKGPPSSTRR